MTATYDYLIIGGGITGSALGYELAGKGQKVLLVERSAMPESATRYSYGGLAYWSGTTEITRKLYREGIDIHRNLCNELGAETEFRDIDLVLTIGRSDDPIAVAGTFEGFDIRPRLLDAREAIELEPLLNPDAISGVLQLPHGHINAWKTNLAYQRAFVRRGGEIVLEAAIELILDDRRVRGVRTDRNEYRAGTTIVCAGGLTRSFLQKAGISVKCYFTRAGMIALDRTAIALRTLVMPATGRRIFLERQVSEGENEGIWDRSPAESIDSVLEAGAIQFRDGSLYIGQVSAIVTDPIAPLDAIATEANIRAEVGEVLPALRDLPGTYRECLVAFAPLNRPVVGPIEGFEGIQVFSGFTSTLVAAPPLARHFARSLVGEEDEIIREFTGGKK